MWMSATAPESEIQRTRSDAEQCARTSADAILAAAQNGTSGVLASSRHIQPGVTDAGMHSGSHVYQASRYYCPGLFSR
jgi:hypothetical protein